MAGFSNISGDESIVYADNVSFNGTERGGKVTANGQLLIGSTVSPHIRVGTLSSTGGSVTITVGSGTINLEAGATTPLSFPTDSGTATPAANALTISGQLAGTIPAMFTIGSGSTVDVEDRTWVSSFVVDPSSTVGLRGTFTTIQAAITAASAGQNIFIRPGTYTENLTLKSGVNLIGMCNSFRGDAPVKISGKATLTSGHMEIDNILFATNSDYLFDISGSSTISVYRSFFSIGTTGAFTLNSGNVNLLSCGGSASSGSCPLITAINSSSVQVYSCTFLSSSTAASTFANGGSLTVGNSTFQNGVSTSDTAIFQATNSSFGSIASALPSLVLNGTGTNCFAFNCEFLSPGNTFNVSVGTGATLNLSNCSIFCNLAGGVAIAGAGTLNYSSLTFPSTASTITTTTQVPKISSNDALKITSPGAYPYTTVPQDSVILVDTSSARTITPLASPTTGQKHIIKDSVGSAAANNITITPSGKNIDGAASSTMNVNYGSVTIIYNGTEWSIV